MSQGHLCTHRSIFHQTCGICEASQSLAGFRLGSRHRAVMAMAFTDPDLERFLAKTAEGPWSLWLGQPIPSVGWLPLRALGSQGPFPWCCHPVPCYPCSLLWRCFLQPPLTPAAQWLKSWPKFVGSQVRTCHDSWIDLSWPCHTALGGSRPMVWQCCWLKWKGAELSPLLPAGALPWVMGSTAAFNPGA